MGKNATLAFLLTMLCIPAFCQSAKLTYTEKLPYNNRLTPDAAVTNAWNWFDNNTKVDPKEKEAKIRNQQGVFKGISSFQYVSKVASGNEYSKGTIYYTVRMLIHDTDGAYTYEISNFSHQARFSLRLLTTDTKYPYHVDGDKMWHNMVWKDIRQQVDQHAKELAASLKAAMQAPSVIAQNGRGPKVIIVRN